MARPYKSPLYRAIAGGLVALVPDLPSLPPSEDEISPPPQGLRPHIEAQQLGNNWPLKQEHDTSHNSGATTDNAPPPRVNLMAKEEHITNNNLDKNMASSHRNLDVNIIRC